jgi:hypothetical protein
VAVGDEADSQLAEVREISFSIASLDKRNALGERGGIILHPGECSK